MLERPAERLGLAIAWLHAEYAAARQHDQPDRYHELLTSLLPSMRRALPPNHRAYTTMLLELPAIDTPMLVQMLREDLHDEQRSPTPSPEAHTLT